MEADLPPDLPWLQLSEFIAGKIGLHFPPERRMDLQRGLGDAATEFGFADATACAHWLLSTTLTRPQLHTLASHLTVGETYFFRERKTFDALAEHILPELIHRRRSERHLRLWSAACCTGEEAYSLAIVLHQCIPDWRDWRIHILATDINERFLRKAATGVYGEWSFREAPPGFKEPDFKEPDFKERYFTRTPQGQFAVLPHLKQTVTFAPLNLAEDCFPSFATDTHAMDLIFCRNVLMYFTPAQAGKVVEKLRRALLDDAWLAVGASDGSHALLNEFAPLNFPGAILYRKQEVRIPPTPAAVPAETPPSLPIEAEHTGTVPSALPAPHTLAAVLFQQGRYAEAADTLLASFVPDAAPPSPALSLLTRALANRGQLSEALAWCDRWVAADALDSTARYLRAMVLQELGSAQEARRSLQQALYLQPDFVLAHFALGNLARSGGNAPQAHKHFANALALLRGRPPDELLPESDGLTAGRVEEIVTALLALEVAA